jgi:hypothetical protein
MTLPNIILQLLHIFLTRNDKPQEPLMRAGRGQRLFGDLDDADCLGRGGGVRFGGAEKEVGFLDVGEGGDLFDVDTGAEKEVKDALFEDGGTMG